MPSYLDDNNFDENGHIKKNLTGNNKTPSKKDIALDKLEMSGSSAPKRKKKSDKINGRGNATPFVRFAISAFPQADDPPGEKFRKAFLLMATAVLIGALVFLGWQIFSIAKGSETNRQLAEIAGSPINTSGRYSQPDRLANPDPNIATSAGTEEPEFIDLTPVVNTPLNINFSELKSINPDTRAWIKLTGTLINYPVVHSTDNDYYLHRDLYGNYSFSGTVFSSYLNRWDGTDDNIILFGHNMQAGTYFSYLAHYVPNDWSTEPLAFYKVHPTIQLATPDGKNETFKIFAGMYVNTEERCGEVFQYINRTRFSGVDDFNQFILDVMDRSWFYTDVDLQYGDDLLTLSTCSWPLGEKACDTRWVVLARRVRDGESETVDTTVAKRNYNPKLFEYWYKVRGGSWKGRTWDTSKLLSY